MPLILTLRCNSSRALRLSRPETECRTQAARMLCVAAVPAHCLAEMLLFVSLSHSFSLYCCQCPPIVLAFQYSSGEQERGRERAMYSRGPRRARVACTRLTDTHVYINIREK